MITFKAHRTKSERHTRTHARAHANIHKRISAYIKVAVNRCQLIDGLGDEGVWRQDSNGEIKLLCWQRDTYTNERRLRPIQLTNRIVKKKYNKNKIPNWFMENNFERIYNWSKISKNNQKHIQNNIHCNDSWYRVERNANENPKN